MTVWQQRLDGYKREFIERDAFEKSRSKQRADIIFASGNPDWGALSRGVGQSLVDVRATWVVAGRGKALTEFIAHIHTNPTVGLTEVWFQGRIDEMSRVSKTLDGATQQYLADLPRSMSISIDWIGQGERFAQMQGEIQGRYEEMNLLYRNALAYFVDQRIAEARDQRAMTVAQQRWAAVGAALAGAAAFVQQSNHQQQLLNDLSRPRTCQRLGNVVSCR